MGYKKVLFFVLVVSVFLLTAAKPKPGPMIILTLINKAPSAEAYISMTGTTNFYNYYLRAKTYNVEIQAENIGATQDDKLLKTLITTYTVRKDRYEVVISVPGCNNFQIGLIDLYKNTTLVFPSCKNVAQAYSYGIRYGSSVFSKYNIGEPSMRKINKPEIPSEIDLAGLKVTRSGQLIPFH